MARLETAVQNSNCSFPPPIPPKGIPPGQTNSTDRLETSLHLNAFPSKDIPPPQLNSESTEAGGPPIPTSPLPRSESPTPLPPPLPPLVNRPHPIPKTPQPPHHPPPTLAYTPCAPRHHPPTFPLTPHASNHPPPRHLLSTPPPPSHPPPQLPRRESREQAPPTLPSSSIPKSSLLPVSSVVHNYADLVGKEGKMTTLAVALAREAFFGEEVMAQCTAKGHDGKPGLPQQELMALKEEIRRLFPNYWNSPLVFEEKWNKCSEQISQACNRVRAKRRKKGLNTNTD